VEYDEYCLLEQVTNFRDVPENHDAIELAFARQEASDCGRLLCTWPTWH
jgi:hypothetical protein